MRADAAPPSGEDLKQESLRYGEELSMEGARAILLDPKKGAALKLAVVDKLRTQNPEEVVPLLVEFLSQPATPSSSYTKPTAVSVLAQFKDPVAEEALARLSRTSPDERVRLTIAALQAKEKAR